MDKRNSKLGPIHDVYLSPSHTWLWTEFEPNSKFLVIPKPKLEFNNLFCNQEIIHLHSYIHIFIDTSTNQTIQYQEVNINKNPSSFLKDQRIQRINVSTVNLKKKKINKGSK